MPPRSERAKDIARAKVIAKNKAKAGDPSPNGGPPFLNDSRIQEINRNLRSRAVVPSRFYHKPSMEILGADAQLQVMFQNLGWGNFVNASGFAYACLTGDFLKSYAYDLVLRVVTFKLAGNPYSLSFDDINAAMGVDIHSGPLEGRFDKAFLNFKKAAQTEFWQSITNDRTDFDSYKRDYRIIHPIWILAHRILATTIEGRKETGQVYATELFILYCMYKKIRVDFCDFFLEKCDWVRGRPSGDISISGLVTLIAARAGFDFNSIEDEPLGDDDAMYLKLKDLHEMSLIRGSPQEGYVWLTGVESDPKAKFPCFQVTPRLMSSFKINLKKTWKPKYDYPIPVTPQVPSSRGESSRGDDDEEMDETEAGGGGDEHVNVGGGYEGMTEQQEEDTIPLSYYQQLTGLRTDFDTFSRNTNSRLDEHSTHISQVLQSNNQMLLSQNEILRGNNQIQQSLQFMMNQGHDLWSHSRPTGGYPSYPPPQPPQDPFYPYPPPPYGYPPYDQYPPPGGYGFYPPPPGGGQQ